METSENEENDDKTTKTTTKRRFLTKRLSFFVVVVNTGTLPQKPLLELWLMSLLTKNIAGRLSENSRNSFVDLQSQKDRPKKKVFPLKA